MHVLRLIVQTRPSRPAPKPGSSTAGTKVLGCLPNGPATAAATATADGAMPLDMLEQPVDAWIESSLMPSLRPA